MDAPPTPEAVRARLDALRDGRGFLLPHHGAMAAALPDLHAAYGTMYAALTLTDHHLTPFEREFVWLCILVAGREPVGTHHAEAFTRTGGSIAQARLALQLTGYAGAADAFGFVAEHWTQYFPNFEAEESYAEGIRRLTGDLLPAATCHLALAAVHALQRRPWGLAASIRAAYVLDPPPEDKLAEALALVMWPAGVNRFVDACTVWHRLMRDGTVTPSARYQAWADTPGIGAFTRPRADLHSGPPATGR